MIVPPDSTAEVMLEALGTTLGALDAASSLDIDRTAEDKAFFTVERAQLAEYFDAVFDTRAALEKFEFVTGKALQVAVVIGDKILDRGVRSGKSRMRLELKTLMPGGEDLVFPENVDDIVNAELAIEPSLVLKVLTGFPKVPDFSSKDAIKDDLQGRAERQNACIAKRTAGEVTEASLVNALEAAIRNGSDALYGLEKRLLDRFKREKIYVRAFFMDVTPTRKKAAAQAPAAAPAKPGGGDTSARPGGAGESPAKPGGAGESSAKAGGAAAEDPANPKKSGNPT